MKQALAQRPRQDNHGKSSSGLASITATGIGIINQKRVAPNRAFFRRKNLAQNPPKNPRQCNETHEEKRLSLLPKRGSLSRLPAQSARKHLQTVKTSNYQIPHRINEAQESKPKKQNCSRMNASLSKEQESLNEERQT